MRPWIWLPLLVIPALAGCSLEGRHNLATSAWSLSSDDTGDTGGSSDTGDTGSADTGDTDTDTDTDTGDTGDTDPDTGDTDTGDTADTGIDELPWEAGASTLSGETGGVHCAHASTLILGVLPFLFPLLLSRRREDP